MPTSSAIAHGRCGQIYFAKNELERRPTLHLGGAFHIYSKGAGQVRYYLRLDESGHARYTSGLELHGSDQWCVQGRPWSRAMQGTMRLGCCLAHQPSKMAL